MPPRWKVQRELHRVWLQIKGLAEPFTGRVLKPLYDRSKGKKIKITEGAVPLGGDVAVFLIYAPGGFPRSLFRTLEHLKDTGFSTLVVANHPLSDEDRQQLAPYTWRIMSRPNVGYDFGGYREGILHLIDEGITPDNLLVLNDSMWFPLLDGDTMLDDMRKWPENIRGFSTDRHKRSNLKPFVQSFLFMYDREIVASPEFAEYWRSIVLSNNKNVVIRKLEMGMSVHFANLGFDVRSLHDYSRIGETLAALPKDRQIRFLEIEAPRLNGHGEQAMARLEAGEALSQNTWQELGELSQVDGHILKLPPELLFDVFQVNMIKKLKVGHFVEQRHMIKDGGYCDRMDPVIRSELETRDDPKDVARIITYYEDRRQREAEWARKKAELNGSTADSL